MSLGVGSVEFKDSGSGADASRERMRRMRGRERMRGRGRGHTRRRCQVPGWAGPSILNTKSDFGHCPARYWGRHAQNSPRIRSEGALLEANRCPISSIVLLLQPMVGVLEEPLSPAPGRARSPLPRRHPEPRGYRRWPAACTQPTSAGSTGSASGDQALRAIGRPARISPSDALGRPRATESHPLRRPTDLRKGVTNLERRRQ